MFFSFRTLEGFGSEKNLIQTDNSALIIFF